MPKLAVRYVGRADLKKKELVGKTALQLKKDVEVKLTTKNPIIVPLGRGKDGDPHIAIYEIIEDKDGNHHAN